MSNDFRHVELLTGDVRRRRWTSEQKLTINDQSFEPGEMVFSTARGHGVAPNLLYRWCRLLSEGGAAAVDSGEPVVGNSEVKKLAERVRELERMLGRVIEERAAGNPDLALKIRERVGVIIGDSPCNLKAGSQDAARVKTAHIEEGIRSQYLEVGIGPDAEVLPK